MLVFLSQMPGIYTFGRDSSCDIVISDPAVNRRHMQLAFEDGGKCYCVDLNSKNGTFVNGRRIIDRVQVCYLDKIQIGHTSFSIETYFAPEHRRLGY